MPRRKGGRIVPNALIERAGAAGPRQRVRDNPLHLADALRTRALPRRAGRVC